jgi:hypothetical protein
MELDENGKPIETDVREIPQSAMRRCPHYIMVAEHYRADNSCRCDDKDHHEMAEWGYAWDGLVWLSPQEVDED